jgi:hypothetical protein
LPALVFAAQIPYSGWQNIVNSRNVMRNAHTNLLNGGIHAAQKKEITFKMHFIGL